MAGGIDRRRFLAAGTALAALPASACKAAATRDETPPADWPEWAPSLSAHYRRVSDMAGRGVSLTRFGVTADGVTDDTEAMRRAVASDASVLLLPRGKAIRLTGPVPITRSIAILADTDAAPIVWEGNVSTIFVVEPPDRALDRFTSDLTFDGITVTRGEGLKPGGYLVVGRNVRDIAVTRCRADRVDLAWIAHLRQDNGYNRRAGSADVDPAVLVGFSPDHTDDLNRGVLVADNTLDYGQYTGRMLRFDFASHVVAFRNTGRFANISWWGGGARRAEGGALQHLRRVRHAYIAENTLSGSNGGVYGNNGQNIVVARNTITQMADVGVDFEGCMDCRAYGNRVSHIGNYCYATFYAALNIVFEDNYGEQDGSAAGLGPRLGVNGYGKGSGTRLVALRSSSFGRDKSIDVTFRRNRFVWSGKEGTGNCLPSFYDRLTFEDNLFENVICDLRDRLVGAAVVRGNRFRFDRAVEAARNVIAVSAWDSLVEENEIVLARPLPDDSNAILCAFADRAPRDITARANRMTGPGGGNIRVIAQRGVRGNLAIVDNTADAIALDPLLGAVKVQVSGNRDRSGRTVVAG